MTHTGHSSKTPRSTGIFATLRAFLHAQGTGAPSRTLLILAFLLIIATTMALSSASALAARGSVFSKSFGSGPCVVVEPLEPCVGKFDEPSGVALNQATGEVYVIDAGNDRVEYFTSEDVYQGEFNGSGTDLLVEGSAAPTGQFQFSSFAGASQDQPVSGIAVDNDPASPSYQDVYVTDVGHGVIDKFSSTGAYLGQVTGTCKKEKETPPSCAGSTFTPFVAGFGGLEGIAVDSNGELWVAQQEAIDNFSSAVANEFLSSRKPKLNFEKLSPGFAVDSEDNLYVNGLFGEVYKLNGSGEILIVEEEITSGRKAASIAVDPSTGDAYIGAGSSVGVFDPTGSPTGFDKSIVGVLIERFGSEQLTDGGAAGMAVDFASGPSAGNRYVSDSLADQVFIYVPEPPAKPALGGESVSNVSSDSATLGAQINPRGVDTQYYFQYGTVSCTASPSSCTDVPLPLPGADIGSEFAVQSVGASLQGLEPSTVYHYRVIAHNSFGGGNGSTVEGPDQTFTTQGPGGPLVLPDGRAWEMVSPVQKLGAQVIPTGGALIQASEGGSAISYYLTAPFVANPAGNVRLAQAISRRGPDGWSAEDIATPHTGPTFVGTVQGEYRFFSSDLSHSLVEPFGETPLPPLGEGAEQTIYLRNNAKCESTPTEAIPATCYVPLVTAANVPSGTKFGGHENTVGEGVEFVTGTPDLGHIVLSSHEALTANSTGGLYEWSAGRLQPIPITVGYRANNRRVISNDGSRIFGSGEMANMTTGEVVRTDKAQGVPEPNVSEARFQIASSDGSLVFFSDSAQLTTSPGGGLYAYNVETGKLTLVTIPLHGADEFRGLVLGASEDGSYVYLVDGGVLSEASNAAGEKAVAGNSNLYVLHREMHADTETWTPSFIASLSAGDETEWSPRDVGGQGFEMSTQTVEVSPDGRYLAFMSDRSLTGYDNRDANSGEPDEEVYRYDAVDARLLCASCNPTGARPVGAEPVGFDLSDLVNAWSGHWVAATIPGMTEVVYNRQAVYEPRYILNSGQLFFDSHDALVPQDVNGVGDVYEYESGGTGGCPAASVGCVALLSGGTGPDESAFEDASASGDDVFFVTADKLVPQDVGNEYDMYDAHVCSAEAPCPVSVVAPAPCTTADSCKLAISPQSGIFGPSGSATFSGPGNPTPPLPAVKPAVKSLTKAQKLAKALKACRKKPKRKRASCQKQARKRFGASKAKKSAKGRKQHV